ncbi:hypothetical protein OG884_03715 [Streptosporangium sp. NBC_01755]|uniref:hypothetical protein n=1 Tax=Streptosporangium sp. NBC_01755 TaxID=2975949 RepID=UPI002DD8FF40|nr:hypothetical protein [Streptosporangium sp. NBC_01755]WSD01057.1 hypothetical protein OG884_03715 [Streptosporangium sp. NBC_01755]
MTPPPELSHEFSPSHRPDREVVISGAPPPWQAREISFLLVTQYLQNVLGFALLGVEATRA